MRRSAAWGRDLSQMNGRRWSAARSEGGVEVIHRLPRKGRRKLAMFAGLATIVSFLVLSPVVANADAGNPILGSIHGTIRSVASTSGSGLIARRTTSLTSKDARR